MWLQVIEGTHKRSTILDVSHDIKSIMISIKQKKEGTFIDLIEIDNFSVEIENFSNISCNRFK